MSTITQQHPVNIFPSAVTELKRLLEQEPLAAGKLLRVGVKGGGCSGMTYVLDFDDPKPGDKHFDVDGLPCIIDPAHELYLFGMEVHWDDGLNSRGFTFRNPNASTTCGCGTSFAV